MTSLKGRVVSLLVLVAAAVGILATGASAHASRAGLCDVLLSNKHMTPGLTQVIKSAGRSTRAQATAFMLVDAGSLQALDLFYELSPTLVKKLDNETYFVRVSGSTNFVARAFSKLTVYWAGLTPNLKAAKTILAATRADLKAADVVTPISELSGEADYSDIDDITGMRTDEFGNTVRRQDSMGNTDQQTREEAQDADRSGDDFGDLYH